MSFDPDKDAEQQSEETHDLLRELILHVKRVALLLEILTETEVSTEDVEEK